MSSDWPPGGPAGPAPGGRHATPAPGLRRALGRLEGLRRLDGLIIAGVSREELAAAALEHVARLIALDRAAVALYDDESGTAEVLALYPESSASPTRPGARFPLHEVVPPGSRDAATPVVSLDLERQMGDLEVARRMVLGGYRAACWAPLRADGPAIGTLSIMASDPGVFHGDAADIAAEVASQLAIGIRAARERAARRLATERLSLVHAIDRAILEAETLEDLARRAAPLLRRLVGADRLIVARYDLDAGVGYRLAVDRGHDGPPDELGDRVPLDRLVTPAQVADPRLLVMPDLAAAAEEAPGVAFLARQGMRAGVYLPLVAHGRLQGAVVIGWLDEHLLSAVHVEAAREVADQLAVALLHADARDRLQRAATRLEIIHDIDRAILAAERPVDIAARSVESLRRLAGADRVSVALFDLDRRVSRLIAFAHATTTADLAAGAEFDLDETVDRAILDRHETVVYRDLAATAEELPALGGAVRAGATTAVVVPLVASGRLLGVLALAGADPIVASEDNVAVASDVSAQIAIALEHAQAKEAAERSASRLALVHAVDEAILRAETPEAIASAVAERMLGVTGAELVVVARFRPGLGRTVVAAAGEGAEDAAAAIRAMPPLAADEAPLVPAGGPLVLEDLRDGVPLLPPVRVAVERGLTVGMVMPMVVGGRVIGAVGLAGRDRALVGPDAIATAREVGDQLAVAITAADGRLELERRVEQQRLVHAIDDAILASVSPEDLAGRVAAPLADLLHARRLDIAAYDMARGTARILAHAHDGTSAVSPVGAVFPVRDVAPLADLDRPTTRVVTDLPSLRSLPHARRALEAGLDRLAWIPLVAGGRLLGALGLGGDDPAMTEPSTVLLAEALGDQLAVAIQHANDAVALAEREARLRAILDASPNGILTLRPAGTVEYANPAAHALFGAPAGGLVGLGNAALVPVEVAAAHAGRVGAWLEDPAAAPNPHPVNLEARRLDGSTFPAHVRVARIATPAEPLVLVTVVDLSERAALEARLRQAERLQTLGEFAGILAHDVRNYLTAVTWAAEVLAVDLDPDDPRHADVELIQRSTQDAVDMTRSVLEFARPAGDPRGVLDVRAHLAGTRAVLDRILGDEVALEVDVEPGLPHAGISATAMTQVLGNLATNARDAMPHGGTVRIAAARHEASTADGDGTGLRPGAYVRLTVTDTGVGMDDATRGRAFEPFYTTKTAASTARGTGLGLSSVFLIVTKAGGAIRVESEPGRGTAFTIDLPVVG